MKIIYLLLIGLSIVSCNTASEKNNNITNKNDYNSYLDLAENKTKQETTKELNFWSQKLKVNPTQFPYLLKIAGSQSQLFQATGNIDNLIAAENSLLIANQKTAYNSASYLRALARNYISQHRFKEALALVKKAEINGENLKATQYMLFDVHLELGNYKDAKAYLLKFEDFKNFNYLIRISKWNDHIGNLKAAIKYLEKAVLISETSKNKSLMQWGYTNLADYYGHNGDIEKSYLYYLKALKINPNDSYSKKGIAWIVYSYERNPVEAMRILNAVSENNEAPDYFLLKAEIADFMEDTETKSKYIAQYISTVKNDKYGDMYNKYSTILFAEELQLYKNAFDIANIEIANRPTPQSYDLLAWVHFNNGNVKEAFDIAKKYVLNKTYEPETLYHLAEIYNAMGNIKETKNLKEELLEAKFELGPLLEQKIKLL